VLLDETEPYSGTRRLGSWVVDVTTTVVVPTFNRAALLERLLAALGNCASISRHEVIVIDDGSTDGTAEVVRRFKSVRYAHQSNAGAAAARNFGLREASGDIVAFIDDDCVPDERWLEDLEAAWARDPDAGGIGGTIRPLVDSRLARFVQLEGLIDHGWDGGAIRALVTANASFRRALLENLGGFDESFPGAAGEDTDLSFRMRAAGHRLVVVQGATVYHDHRTGLRPLLHTYRNHGRGRRLLRSRHPSEGLGADATRKLGPAYWVGRWRSYRSCTSRFEAVLFVALRGAGLLNYVVGAKLPTRRVMVRRQPKMRSHGR